jgi:hypothetical protein
VGDGDRVYHIAERSVTCHGQSCYNMPSCRRLAPIQGIREGKECRRRTCEPHRASIIDHPAESTRSGSVWMPKKLRSGPTDGFDMNSKIPRIGIEAELRWTICLACHFEP